MINIKHIQCRIKYHQISNHTLFAPCIDYAFSIIYFGVSIAQLLSMYVEPISVMAALKLPGKSFAKLSLAIYKSIKQLWFVA